MNKRDICQHLLLGSVVAKLINQHRIKGTNQSIWQGFVQPYKCFYLEDEFFFQQQGDITDGVPIFYYSEKINKHSAGDIFNNGN